MSSNYTVVFDANVLYPAPLRSFLMYLAVSGEFRARWTEMIHDEWIRNLLKKRTDLTAEQLHQTRTLMNENVPGSVVTGFEGLIESITLQDENDRHVVAAAIQTRAEAIITFNLKDFPSSELSKYGIIALHPDEFIANLINLNSGTVIEAARRQRASLKNPSLTTLEFIDLLQKQQLPKTAAFLRKLELII
tara:strand:- start:1789 stop:2361 length:573 start_codon:yes stop_codon:yes gene_type:complete